MRFALLALAALACLAVSHGGGGALAEPQPGPGSAGDGQKWARAQQTTLNKPGSSAGGPQRPQVRTDLRLPARLPPTGSARITPHSASSGRSPASWGVGGGYRRLDSGYSSHGSSRSPSLSPQKTPAAWGLFGRGRTSTPAPAKTAAKQPPCDCNCYSRPMSYLCAMDPVTRDKETFINECQLDCYNCTAMKRYKVVAHVACEAHKED